MLRKVGGIVFAIVVGLAVALFSYRWITNPDSGEARLRQEQVVMHSRGVLEDTVASGQLEIVDPLAPNRKVGKVYIYPEGGGWAVSGYYRRDDSDLWHPYLMQLESDLALSRLKLSDQDPALVERGADDPQIEVLP